MHIKLATMQLTNKHQQHLHN